MTYKDKLQDNYSIFNEFLMNYTQIVNFKFQENGQRLSSERVKHNVKILKFLILPFLDSGSPANLIKPFKTISGSFGVLLKPFCMWGPAQGP